jgi:hypothetical protein
VLGGSIDLEWTPSDGADITGYRIYKGSRPDALSFAADVPNVPTSTLGNLEACSYYYVAVKARDSRGAVSDQYSNIVEGYPHPDIVSVSPAALGRGVSATLVVTGASFVVGAVAVIESPKVAVVASRVDACGRMAIDVAVSRNAPEGPLALTITNPDGGFSTRTAAFRVVTEGTGDPLNVLSVSPGPGATGIDALAPVRVRFSAPLDPASLDGSRFRITRVGGRGTVKLAGDPVIDATGTWVTLSPASPLPSGASYAIVVKGGHGGVHDLSGNPMDADFVQDPAFDTLDLVQSIRAGPAEQVAAFGATLADGGIVSTDSAFVVRFTEAMHPATITAKSFRIRKAGRGKVKLMDGNPVLLADGVSVLMVPAEPLDPSATYEIEIKGGPKGAASLRGVAMAAAHKSSFTTTMAVVGGLGVAE